MDPGALCQVLPYAAGAVTGTTGATTALAGEVAVARTGAGVYTLTLASQAAAGSANCIVMLTMRTSGTYSYAHTSATVKTVSTFAVDGVTATDKSFDFVVHFLPPSQ